MKKIYIALIIISSSPLICSDNASQNQSVLNDSNRQESGTVTPPTTGTPAEPPMLRRTGRGFRLVDVPADLNPEQILALLNVTRVLAQPRRLDFSYQNSDDMPVR